MEIKSSEWQEAVRTTLAAKILTEIKTEHRDALLAKSITEALGDYSFKSALEKTVAEEAAKAAQILLRTEKWEKKIAQAVQEGCDKFISLLPDAVYSLLKKTFAGDENSSYSYRGDLLPFLQAAEAKEGEK